MEKIKNIINKYSSYIVTLVPLAWLIPGFKLIDMVDGSCTESNLLRIICGYVFTVLPLWLGVFISNKKLLYFVLTVATKYSIPFTVFIMYRGGFSLSQISKM